MISPTHAHQQLIDVLKLPAGMCAPEHLLANQTWSGISQVGICDRFSCRDLGNMEAEALQILSLFSIRHYLLCSSGQEL